MNVLQIVDTPGWAIDELTGHIRHYNKHINFTVLYVPPRDVAEHLREVEEAAGDVDIIQFEYWNTARQLLEKLPSLRGIPSLLTHHNQKNLLSADWDELKINLHVCKTQRSYDVLNEKYENRVTKVPNVVDVNNFIYNDKYPPVDPLNPLVKQNIILGYVGRILPWKGLKEVARAAYELKLPLEIMGRQDKPAYWAEIPPEHKENMDFNYFNCADGERIDYYRSINFYIGNSRDGREEGTLGFLEALSMGVPVITTRAGMAADIITDGVNGILVDFENYESLKAGIERALAMTPGELNKMRKAGWNTVKQFNPERYAIQYGKIFNKLLYGPNEMVSVIIPATFDRGKQIKEIIESLEQNQYNNIEAIVVWDEKDKMDDSKWSDQIIVKEIYTGRADGYNLAMARNMGVIAAEGDMLMFCDSRLKPDPDSVNQFKRAVLGTKDKVWAFGDKGSGKRNFVENFSAIRREYLIKAGMFNERITEYGGMSQELRSRFLWQGFEPKYIGEARATEIKSSKLNNNRRKSIVKMKNLLYRLGL